MAMAPAGVVASITTTSLLLGEQTSSKASSRIASKSMDTATKFLLQRRTLATSTEPVKKAAVEGAKLEKTGVETASVGADELVPRMTFLQWYESKLLAAPVKTKMATGCFLWGVGDATAQIVPYVATHDPDKPPFKYDLERTGRACLFGFALHAPTSHVHFNFLEWMTVKSGLTGLSIPVFKTIMEQFVYWSWISNTMYHAFMGAMQGQNLDQIYQRVADVLWETQKAQWVFWIPIQLLNFRFVPVRHQLNIVLLTSIVWTALLSAWYSDVGDEKKIEEDEAAKAQAKKVDDSKADVQKSS